jgi:hypothetical protein
MGFVNKLRETAKKLKDNKASIAGSIFENLDQVHGEIGRGIRFAESVVDAYGAYHVIQSAALGSPIIREKAAKVVEGTLVNLSSRIGEIAELVAIATQDPQVVGALDRFKAAVQALDDIGGDQALTEPSVGRKAQREPGRVSV